MSRRRDGRDIWYPGETVMAEAHDTPVIGWQGKWANTLRLWGAKSTGQFDLERFNRGDYTAAAEPETLARTLSRVLYPDDTTYQGKELRLKQEFFLTSAALAGHSAPLSGRPFRPEGAAEACGDPDERHPSGDCGAGTDPPVAGRPWVAVR